VITTAVSDVLHTRVVWAGSGASTCERSILGRSSVRVQAFVGDRAGDNVIRSFDLPSSRATQAVVELR
jgi:hypothetical protein